MSEQISDNELQQILTLLEAETDLLNALDELSDARQRWQTPSGKADTLQAAAKVQQCVYRFCSALVTEATEANN